VARTREVAGGGRAVEVEPARLAGWFARFTARHGDLVSVDGSLARLSFQAADRTSAEVAVPFGGLPADSGRAGHLPAIAPPVALGPGGTGTDGSHVRAVLGETVLDRPDPDDSHPADPHEVLRALHAHLAVPRRVGIVLVRLGGYSVGVAVNGVVETSSTGARPVHGRNRKGGSSSGRFARRRDNQARVALDAAADVVARVLLPVADTLDAVVLGGDAAALDDLRADRRLAALLARAEPRVLDVPEPRRVVLDEAARRALAVEIVVREPAP
jgi:hypothetical protein